MTLSYKVFHFTRLYGDHKLVCATMPKKLRASFLRCHQLSSNRQKMSLAEQRQFFEGFILWQNGTVIGSTFTDAFDEFDWPLAKWFCARPWVWFSYFGIKGGHTYKDYCDAKERTKNDLKAFDWAAKKSWASVEKNLVRNPFFPRKFTFDASTYIADLGMAPITAP